MAILKNQKIKRSTRLSLNELPQCEEWFKENGLKFSPSRFKKAVKKLNEMYSFSSAPTNDELWQIIELYDLIEVYHHLKNVESKLLVENFKKALGGSDLLSDESKTTARDFFFEIKVAERLTRAKLEIDFDTAFDLSAKINGCEFNIECKRVQKIKTLHRNIKKQIIN